MFPYTPQENSGWKWPPVQGRVICEVKQGYLRLLTVWTCLWKILSWLTPLTRLWFILCISLRLHHLDSFQIKFSQNVCFVSVCRRRVVSSLGIFAQWLFKWKNRRISEGGSHKQEYTGTRTWPTNDKGSSEENQTWSITVIY